MSADKLNKDSEEDKRLARSHFGRPALLHSSRKTLHTHTYTLASPVVVSCNSAGKCERIGLRMGGMGEEEPLKRDNCLCTGE